MPNQITENLAYPGWLRYRSPRHPGQLLRAGSVDPEGLTLQGGLRWDNGITNYTSTRSAVRSISSCRSKSLFPLGSTQGINWKDITPRVGVAYDLFGNGKTALKFNAGKFLEGLSSLFGLDMNPIFRIPTMTTGRG